MTPVYVCINKFLMLPYSSLNLVNRKRSLFKVSILSKAKYRITYKK